MGFTSSASSSPRPLVLTNCRQLMIFQRNVTAITDGMRRWMAGRCKLSSMFLVLIHIRPGLVLSQEFWERSAAQAAFDTRLPVFAAVFTNCAGDILRRTGTFAPGIDDDFRTRTQEVYEAVHLSSGEPNVV